MPSLRPAAALAIVVAVLAIGTANAAPPDDPADNGPPDSAVMTGEEFSWSFVPATSDGAPTSAVSIRLDVEPEQTLTEHVLLTNHSERAATFEIAGADGVLSADGTFDVLPPDEVSRDVGAWIDIQPTAEVPAGESVLIPFTITIPALATPGDHPGGIVASLSRETAAADGPQVDLTARVGVRVHLRVAGELDPTVTISNVQASYDASLNPFRPGSLHIAYTVTNTGNVRIGSRQQAEIAGTFGLPTGAETGPAGVVGEQREILPGQSATVDAVIDGVWPLGRLSADLSATQAAVGDDAALDALEPVDTTASVWALPWTQLLIVLVVVAALVIWRKRRRARQREFERALADAKADGAREAADASDDTHDEDATIL